MLTVVRDSNFYEVVNVLFLDYSSSYTDTSFLKLTEICNKCRYLFLLKIFFLKNNIIYHVYRITEKTYDHLSRFKK